MYGLCERIRNTRLIYRRDNPTRALTVSHQIGLERISAKTMTVYATMQPGPELAAASMGPAEVGSTSGALEMMAKSEVKESICVCVWVERC